jgi:hypothetical protein
MPSTSPDVTGSWLIIPVSPAICRSHSYLHARTHHPRLAVSGTTAGRTHPRPQQPAAARWPLLPGYRTSPIAVSISLASPPGCFIVSMVEVEFRYGIHVLEMFC